MLKKAFTLAEVLIAMGVIGIIAMQTIVPLKSKIDKQNVALKLKKAYTNASQAIKLMAQDKNCVDDLACTEIFNSSSTMTTVGDEFVKYFKVIKNCKTTDDSCHKDRFSDSEGTNPYMLGNEYRFITTDNIGIYITTDSNNCTTDYGDGVLDKSGCGSIMVYIPGLGNYSIAGKDIFYFYITKNATLYPYGGQYANGKWTTSCSSSTYFFGQSCTGRIVEKGWVIDY